GAGMAGEQTPARPARNEFAGNFCSGRRAFRVSETLRRCGRRRRHGRRRSSNQVGFVVLNQERDQLGHCAPSLSPSPRLSPLNSQLRPNASLFTTYGIFVGSPPCAPPSTSRSPCPVRPAMPFSGPTESRVIRAPLAK